MPMSTPQLPPKDRQGVTYSQAREILAAHGLHRSVKTLRRWVDAGILNVKRITHRTVILFRDEVEALAKKGNPYE
jgi:predicted site-specific integrase-resolvase